MPTPEAAYRKAQALSCSHLNGALVSLTFVLDPRARHADRFGSEGADELAVAMPVPIALLQAAAAVIAAAPDDGRKFFLEQRLDRSADVLPQAVLDGIITGITAQ